MENKLRTLLELDVLAAYDEKGIENIFRSIRGKEEARKDAKKLLKKNFNDREHDIAFITCKLATIEVALQFKRIVKENDNLNYLGEKLIELGNELKEIK